MKTHFAGSEQWAAIPRCHVKDTLDKTYYHFFFGVLLPLLELSRRILFSPYQTLWLESCGPFDNQLAELRELLPLRVVPFAEIANAVRMGGARPFYLDSMELYLFFEHGFAIRPAAYDGEHLRAIARHTKPYFMDWSKQDYPEVLIVDREDTRPHHGATTRRIPNTRELEDGIRSTGLTVATRCLEGCSLEYQINLFHRVRWVIAQHGSALCNLVWSTSKTKVLELVPRLFSGPDWQYFSTLSEELGISRAEIVQNDPFEPVDVKKILKAVQSL